MPNIIKFHPQYVAMKGAWQECRDFTMGEDAVKEHDLACGGAIGEAYLVRKSSKQSDARYRQYVDGAVLFEAMALTIRGLKGLVFSRDPDITIPEGAKDLVTDCDLQGTPLRELTEKALEELLITGRGGILVDHLKAIEGLSKLDEDKLKLRPYMNIYVAEDIVSWRFGRVGSISILTNLQLREASIYDENFVPSTSYLDYTVVNVGTVFQKLVVKRISITKDAQGQEIETEELLETPKKKGVELRNIPFFFFSTNGTDWTPAKPPLLGLVKINRAHYRNSAQLEHGLDYCGNPASVFAGFPELLGDEAGGKPNPSIEIDSSKAIITREATGHWGYLEFTGQGLLNIERALDRKEALMAKLGSRMLYDNKKAAEAAEALKIRYSGESASLADIANVLSRAITLALEFECAWYEKPGTVKVHLNTDYVTAGADANEINVLWQMYIKGGIVGVDLVRRLKTVGVIGPDRDVEDVLKEMAEAQKKIKAEEAAVLAAENAAKTAAQTKVESKAAASG